MGIYFAGAPEEDAERRGEEREKQRRIADNKAMAKEMINDNIPISFIAKYTKLSVDEIKNLNKQST